MDFPTTTHSPTQGGKKKQNDFILKPLEVIVLESGIFLHKEANEFHVVNPSKMFSCFTSE